MKVPAPQEPTQCWRGCMDEFTVIPALDLKGDAVVHAKSGNRADYRPIESPLRRCRRPLRDRARPVESYRLAVALYRRSRRHRRRRQSFRAGPRAELRASRHRALWIDAGFSDVADCAFWLPLGATLVIGSESLAGVEDWREIHAAFGEGVVLSLDFDAGGRKGPDALFDDASLWPLRVIAMDLSRVGTDQGPDTDGIKSLVGMALGPRHLRRRRHQGCARSRSDRRIAGAWRAARDGAASQCRHAK